ncbi:MAG: glycosyltransferase, partial [Bacteroidota bacterium]
MKVVQINTYENQGGAARAAHRLHEGLVAQNVDSSMLVLKKYSSDNSVEQVVISPAVSQSDEEKLLTQSVQEYYINKKRTTISNTFFSLGYPGYAIDNLESVRNADIINLHWILSYQSPSTLSRLFALNKPIVWTFHDFWPMTGGCHFPAGCLKYRQDCSVCHLLENDGEELPKRLLQDKKDIFRRSPLTIVCPSRWLAAAAQSSAVFRDFRVETIPYSLDTNFYDTRFRDTAKAHLGISPKTVVLMFVADNIEEKRKGWSELQQVILLCVADERLRARQNDPPMVLAVAGSTSKAIQQLEIPVVSLGYLDTEQKMRMAYSAADIFILPSLEDNLPNTLLEAMSCGVVPVTFDVGGIPDVVHDGVNGILVEAGNCTKMAKEILRLAFDIKLRDVLGAQSRATAVTDHALAVQAKQYIELYSELISQHSEPRKENLRRGGKSSESKTLLRTKRYETFNVPVDTTFSSDLAKVFKRIVAMRTVRPEHGFHPAESAPHISHCDFSYFTYSKKSHFKFFKRPLFYTDTDPVNANLKFYQDLLVYNFILENIPKGQKILEIGGGDSRIISALKNQYEFWNIDKLEGVGNGPFAIRDMEGFHFVKDYIGAFNTSLPDSYFDFVFSISVLEHVDQKKEVYESVISDIDRVLKPGGFSLHCFDIVMKNSNVWSNQFLYYMYEHTSVLNPSKQWTEVMNDADLYYMSREAYDQYWMSATHKSYEDFGKPFSYNILVRKPQTPIRIPTSGTKKEVHRKTVTMSLTDLPKITIVTPSFNQGEFLEECIDSVLSQNYPNLEYIVMDGGSTDNSKNVIKKYAKYFSYWQSKRDKGQYYAVQEGFRRSSGEIMAWLNSDDKYHAGALWRVAQIFFEHKKVEWITGRPTAWNSLGQLLVVSKELPIWTRQSLWSEMEKGIFLQQESTFWRRSLWQRAGARLSTELKLAADFELWVRFFRYAQLYSVDTMLGGYREHKIQRGHTYEKIYLEEAEKVVKKEKASKLSKQRIPKSRSMIITLEAALTEPVSNSIHSTQSDNQKLVASLTELVGTQFEQLREKESQLHKLKNALDERLKTIQTGSFSLKEKDEENARLSSSLEERLNAIKSASQSLKEKQRELVTVYEEAERRALELSKKEAEIEAIKNTANERFRLLKTMEGTDRQLKAKEKEINDLKAVANERLHLLKEMEGSDQQLKEKEKEIHDLKTVADERLHLLKSMEGTERQLKEKEKEILDLKVVAEERSRLLLEKEAE